MQEQYFTVEQISSMLQMHPKTVQRYIREGKLRAVKVGKGWRVSGHDLSVFTESAPQSDETPTAVVSCVADVYAAERADAIRITNTLTAALNGKPSEYGPCSMQTQYIPEERKLRVSLYGGARVTSTMLESLAMLTEETVEE